MADLGDYEPNSREGAVIEAIKQAFAPADAIHSINTRQTSATGVCLSGWMTNRIAVKAAMHPENGVLTVNQYLLLWRRFVKDQTQQETATHFRWTLNYVRNEEVEALQRLVRAFWAEPGYISPPRLRRPNALKEWLRGMGAMAKASA